MLSRAELQGQLEAADRKWGLESLYYFARFNLGYDAMQPWPHKEVCKFAEDVIRNHTRGMDLEPRGAFKTSIFSQAIPAWLIVHDPDTRILLDSVVLQNSVDNLGVIKAHFEKPRVKFLYGNFVGQKWTTEEITVSKRTKTNLKEPTVRCASVEKIQVGPHYDWIIADDLVSKENVETPEQINKVIDHFKLLFSLLDPDGKILVIGTRWDFRDLYNHILTEMPDFRNRVIDVETGGKDGGLYFPERLTQEFLDRQKNILGLDFYNAQYRNNPMPEDERSKFQKSWFKRYDALPLDPVTQKTIPLYAFITLDPGGYKNKSDEWVFLIGYVDGENRRYFHKIVKGNYRMDSAIEILFQLVQQVGPISVGLETTAGQKYLLEAIQDEMRRRNIYFNIVELPHAVHTKESRIMRLIPQYQCGNIYHSQEMGPLEEQLRRFPKGKDDIADAASMMLEIMIAPRSMKKKRQPLTSVDQLFWAQVIKDRKKKMSSSVLGSEC